MRLAELVERNARTYPDRPALADGRDTMSWASVHSLARSIRRRIGREGAGALIALCGDPGLKALPLVVGLQGAGASVALLASAELGRTERALALWQTDAWTPVAPSPNSDLLDHEIDQLVLQLRGRRRESGVEYAAPSLVFSTSGSTGDPRLVSCPDERFTAVSCSIANVLGLGPHDRILSPSPAHSDYGFNQLVLAAWSGACVIQGDYLSLGHLVGGEHQPPTMLAAGPSQLRLIAGLPEAKVRAASLRLLTSTGAAFPTEIAAQLLDLWPGCQVRSMYGMTECKRVSISTHEQFVANPASVGHPIPNVNVTLDKATNEILVTTPYLMDFESSQSSSGPRIVEIDGRTTLATGDCGRLADDGQLEITGRLSHFAKVHDVRISLAEAEMIAQRHRDVREAAATAHDDQLFIWCESARAVDEDATTEDVRAALVEWAGTIALTTAAVIFLPKLPRLPNGKIDRALLCESALQPVVKAQF